MGYTHYWEVEKGKKVKEGEYKRALGKIKQLVSIGGGMTELSGVLYDKVLADGSGTKGTLPQIEIGVEFNGIDGEKSLAHETFNLPATAKELKDFDFCKTANKPYDKYVTACLCILSEVDGIGISSDGDLVDWKEGIDLAEAITHKVIAPFND